MNPPNIDADSSTTLCLYNHYRAQCRHYRHLKRLKNFTMGKLVVHKMEAAVLHRNTTPDALEQLETLKKSYLEDVGHLNVLLHYMNITRMGIQTLRNAFKTRQNLANNIGAAEPQAPVEQQQQE